MPILGVWMGMPVSSSSVGVVILKVGVVCRHVGRGRSGRRLMPGSHAHLGWVWKHGLTQWVVI